MPIWRNPYGALAQVTSSTSDSRRFTEKTSRPKVWFYGLLVVLLSLFALPFVTLVFLALTSSFSSWPHLVRYILPQTTLDTALLLLLVAAGSSIVGIGCAWLTELCEFPGKRFFSWALVLPLSVPTYIAAYCMTELWDFTGPVQSAMRSLFGWQTSRDYWFPDIHSVWGAAFVFTLVLYPYVFLTARLTFSLQGANVLEVARSLGAGPWRVFLTVALPLIRPAAIAGVTLVLFETLNDIGAVEHLGVRTITFAIFETWLNRDDLGGSIQLAVLALVLIVALSALERRSRRKMNFQSGTRDKPVAPIRLNRFQMTLAFGACSSVLFLGFGVPAFVLAQYLSRRIEQIFDTALFEIIWNTASVSLLAALIAM